MGCVCVRGGIGEEGEREGGREGGRRERAKAKKEETSNYLERMPTVMFVMCFSLAGGDALL